MNLLEIKNQVYSIIIKHGLFDMDKHESEVKCEESALPYRKGLVIAAFEDMGAIGFTKKISNASGNIWVLVKPVELLSQTVEISPFLAESMADTIDNFVDSIKSGWPKTDKMNITEENIASLLQIIHFLIEDDDEKDLDE